MSGGLASRRGPVSLRAAGVWSPLILLALATSIVWAAPAERTLGEAMRVVYVHVALTWAGLLGLAAAALIGLGVLLTGRLAWAGLLQSVLAVALALVALGTLTSVVAANSTWGGGFADEPRARTALHILAVGVILTIGGSWLPWVRLRGALALGLLVYGVLALRATPLLLHPRSPIASSTSVGIQATFVSLSLIFALLGLWVVWVMGRGSGSGGAGQ